MLKVEPVAFWEHKKTSSRLQLGCNMIDGWGIASRTQKEIVWAGWAIKNIATPITEYAVRKYQICKLV